MSDPVKSPSHYDGAYGVECREALANMVDRDSGLTPEAVYWWGCALKYVWRAPIKNGVQDVEKAMQCLEYMKEAMTMQGAHR